MLKGDGHNASEDAKRLLNDLFENYNKMVRPVKNPEDKIRLYLGIKLSQISDIVNSYISFLLNFYY